MGGGRQASDQGRHCTGGCGGVRAQERHRGQDDREHRRHRHEGGSAEWHLHLPGPLQDQDPPEAGDQGLQERDLRKDANRQGEACSDDRQGVPRGGFEEEHLRHVSARSSSVSCPWARRGIDTDARGEASQILLYLLWSLASYPKKKKKKKKKKKDPAFEPLL